MDRVETVDPVDGFGVYQLLELCDVRHDLLRQGRLGPCVLELLLHQAPAESFSASSPGQPMSLAVFVVSSVAAAVTKSCPISIRNALNR